MADDIQNALGRIQGQLEGIGERLDRFNGSLFAPGGIESRTRDLEQEVVMIKTKASMVSAIVATTVTALFSVAGWILKK